MMRNQRTQLVMMMALLCPFLYILQRSPRRVS
jgi:hypothetical protein